MTNKTILLVALILGCLFLSGISQLQLPQNLLESHEHKVDEEKFNHFKDQFALTHSGQWSKIQPNQNSFDWTTSDQISQFAKSNQTPFKWLINISPEYYPTWTTDLESTLKVEENLLSFLKAICQRYENIGSLVLLVSSSDEVEKLIRELGESCGNENLKVKLIKQKKQIYNKKNLIVGKSDQIRLDQNTKKMSEMTKSLKNSRLLQTSIVTVKINYILSGYTLSVSSLSSTTNGGKLATFEWNWQDGTDVDKTESATHIYKYAGTYTVTLTVTDSFGSTGSATLALTLPVPTDLPTASFTFNAAKQVVSFNGIASSSKLGQINQYKWDFGDNVIQISDDPKITHTYTSSNRYTVTLTVIDDHNAKDSTSTLIKVLTNYPPVADFSVVRIFGYIVTVQQKSDDSDGYVAVYQWNWGDGTVNDTIALPTHVYTTDGSFDIVLTVTDDNGAVSGQKKVTVQIPNNNPFVTFTTTASRLTVSFDATGTVSPSGSITEFKWNYGDLSPVETLASPITSHTYASAGGYTTTLTVTDSAGMKGTYSIRVKALANVPPIASFTFVVTGHTLTVTSNSSDSDGTIVEYRWNFGDSSINGTNSSTTSHTYTKSGWYNVTLTVVDNDTQLSKPLIKQVLINDPPVASFIFKPNNFLTIFVDAQASTDDNGISSYSWDWGDSTKSGGMTANHTYVAEGMYTVTLTVFDAQKLSNSVTQSIQVTARNTPPIADFTITTTLSTVDVDGSRSKDNKGVVSYIWNWGDSSPVDTGATARHTYAAKGFYKITLTVGDADGLTGSTSKSVSVSAPISAPVAGFTFKNTGLIIFVDGSTSTDSYGVSSYTWSWGDSTANGSGKTAQHTYAVAGSYDITLTVTNLNDLTNSITKSISVSQPNTPPKASFTFTISGMTVQVDGSKSTDDSGVVSYTWSWGDSTALSTGVTASHMYANKITYPITLTVADAQGLTNSMVVKVTIR